MKLTSPNVETVLDGYRLGSDKGSIAFCSVTLVEGLDEGGSLKLILVDTATPDGGRSWTPPCDSGA